jgi:hypothetical protein
MFRPKGVFVLLTIELVARSMTGRKKRKLFAARPQLHRR